MNTTTKPAWARDLPDQTAEGDPIVYGPRPLAPRLRAVFVEPLGQDAEAPALVAVFTTGEARRLDLACLVPRAPFAPLRDFDEAARVVVMPYGHGIEWACGADLPADYLYEEGTPADLAYATPQADSPSHRPRDMRGDAGP